MFAEIATQFKVIIYLLW